VSPDPVGRVNCATEAGAWSPPCARGRRGAAAPGVGADASGRSVGERPGLCGRTSLASARRDLSNSATDRADGPVDGGTNRLLPAPSAGASEARSVARPRSPRKLGPQLGPQRRWGPAKKLWVKISVVERDDVELIIRRLRGSTLWGCPLRTA